MKTGTRQVKAKSPLQTRAIKPQTLTTYKGDASGVVIRNPKNSLITKAGKKSSGTGIRVI